MSKKNDINSTFTPTEFHFYAPKEKLTLAQLIYNSKDGTYLGRTPASWAKILVFYAIFYTVLAGLFTICIQVLFSTLSETEPKWKLDKSLIGTNPGMGFRPLSDETERGSVIQFNTKKPEEAQYWIELLDDFLNQYQGIGKNEKFCDFNQTHNPQEVCVVDVEKFGSCSPTNKYGYANGRPCVFLKLNKIFDWSPEYYDDPNQLPEEMPKELKEYVNKVPQTDRQQIWVSCNGTNAQDREVLGSLHYYPSQGFPAYYYPYLNQPGYLSPLIAVQFEKLPISRMVNVECRAWAKNILYNGSARDRMGSVTFQLLID